MDNSIQTASGGVFYYDHPEHSTVTIDDIATGLSNVCRYSGQCSEFYSVASHSVLVDDILRHHGAGPMVRRTGLLHDATEAFMSDVPRGLKNMCLYYEDIEEHAAKYLLREFGGLWPFPDMIKPADTLALCAESAVLMRRPFTHLPQFKAAQPFQVYVSLQSPAVARMAWLHRWELVSEMLRGYDAQKGDWCCLQCNEVFSPFEDTSAKFRWAGDRYQHHHAYPVGHCDMVRVDKSVS